MSNIYNPYNTEWEQTPLNGIQLKIFTTFLTAIVHNIFFGKLLYYFVINPIPHVHTSTHTHTQTHTLRRLPVL